MNNTAIAHKRTSDGKSQPLNTHLREVGELTADLAVDSAAKTGVANGINRT